MKNVIFNIDGMSCVVCSGSCKKALLALDGVKRADVNFASGKAVVEYDDKKLSEQDLADAVAKAGYKARFANRKEEKKTVDKELVFTLLRVVLGGALLLWSMLPMLGVSYPSSISPEGNPFVYALVQIILCVPVMALSYKIYFRGYRNLFRLDPNMDSCRLRDTYPYRQTLDIRCEEAFRGKSSARFPPRPRACAGAKFSTSARSRKASTASFARRSFRPGPPEKSAARASPSPARRSAVSPCRA